MSRRPEETNEIDDPLVDAVRRGDRDAFEALMERDGRWVRGAIYSVLGSRDAVDDIAQEVWLSVWRRIGQIESSTRWKPWVFRVARNATLDFLRRKKHQTTFLERMKTLVSRTPAMFEEPADANLEGSESRGLILRAIEGLPEIYRQVFVLRHVEDWSYQEISTALALPVDTVETRLVRARRLLRQALAPRLKA